MELFSSFDKRRVAMVVLVLVIALAAGQIMQSGFPTPQSVARSENGPDAAPMIETENGMRPLPVPPAATLRPLDPPATLPERVQEEPNEFLDEVRYSPFGAPCRPDARVSATASEVRVDLQFACAAWTFALISYDADIREVRLDRFGRATIAFPKVRDAHSVSLSIGDDAWDLSIPTDYSSASLRL